MLIKEDYIALINTELAKISNERYFRIIYLLVKKWNATCSADEKSPIIDTN